MRAGKGVCAKDAGSQLLVIAGNPRMLWLRMARWFLRPVLPNFFPVTAVLESDDIGVACQGTQTSLQVAGREWPRGFLS